MGCGSSSAAAAAGPVRAAPIQVQPGGGTANKPPPNGFLVAPQKKLPPIRADHKPPPEAEQLVPALAAAPTKVDDEKAGKGGVAFSITVDTAGGAGDGRPNGTAPDVDKILRKPLPPRLRLRTPPLDPNPQHLEPLDNAPTVDPELLAEKLRKAEEKRERMLEKRRNSKVTKTSKARRELLKAQEFSDKNPTESAEMGEAGAANPPAGLGGLQQKQAAAEQNRQAQLAAVQEKQRVREERARAARERAKRLKEEMQEAEDLQIEKDEGGGESDSDASWVGEEAGRRKVTVLQSGEQPQQRDSSGYSSRDASSAGHPSELSSRATTGKTVSTVLEDDTPEQADFFE